METQVVEQGFSLPDSIHTKIKQNKFLKVFTIFTRVLLALGFTPSGLTKFSGNRFTQLGIDNSAGFSLRRFIVQASIGILWGLRNFWPHCFC
jgi:hypothetical protein